MLLLQSSELWIGANPQCLQAAHSRLHTRARTPVGDKFSFVPADASGEDASVYSETDVDAISDVVLCLSDYDAEEKRE